MPWTHTANNSNFCSKCHHSLDAHETRHYPSRARFVRCSGAGIDITGPEEKDIIWTCPCIDFNMTVEYFPEKEKSSPNAWSWYGEEP